MQENEGNTSRSRKASQPKFRRCAGCARSRCVSCRRVFVKSRRDELAVDVRAQANRASWTMTWHGCMEQMAACNTWNGSSSLPAPPACPWWLFSTSCAPVASRPRQRAHLHLCSHRTMRTDSAAVESLAARAIYVTGTVPSGQAAVPASGTVACRPETASFGSEQRDYCARACLGCRSWLPTPVRGPLRRR